MEGNADGPAEGDEDDVGEEVEAIGASIGPGSGEDDLVVTSCICASSPIELRLIALLVFTERAGRVARF